MDNKTLSAIPITSEDVKKQLKNAHGMIRSVSWAIVPEVDKSDPSFYQKQMNREEISLNIEELISAVDVDDDLLTYDQLYALRAIRTGLQVAFHVSRDYRKRAGLPDKAVVGRTEVQRTEISEKEQTAGAIALFVFARYVVWHLTPVITNNTFVKNVNVSIDEVDLSRIVDSLKCAIFFLGRSIEREVHGDDQRLVATVYAFAENLQNDIVSRTAALKYIEPYQDVTYQIEDEDFTLTGFEIMQLEDERVEVSEVYPDQVIGNSESVIQVESIMRKVFLYDPVAQVNPIAECGGFQTVSLLSGDPGNGKTLVLSVARTLGRDYAEATGLPYRDLVVPNMVSKMQGESTDLALAYLRKLLDPSTINLGIGDEFEVVMPDHGDDHVSEGDKKVAVEFLKALSGVSTVNRYNMVFLAATNYPQKIDKAMMSRIKSRHYVTGAENPVDYLRFIILNLRKLNNQYPGLVNLKGIDWDKDLMKIEFKNEIKGVNPTATVDELYTRAGEMYDPNDIRFFACFLHMMKLREKTFSLRDCANAIDGVKSHVTDFEIPLEFIVDPQKYRDISIDDKRGLIAELSKKHVVDSGVDFAQMLGIQAKNYAMEALRMKETQLQRDVDKGARSRLVHHLADKRFKNQLSM